MPNIRREKVAEIHKVTTTPTFWERFVEGAKAVGFVIFLMAMFALFLG
jgi:hypothetical protein